VKSAMLGCENPRIRESENPRIRESENPVSSRAGPEQLRFYANRLDCTRGTASAIAPREGTACRDRGNRREGRPRQARPSRVRRASPTDGLRQRGSGGDRRVADADADELCGGAVLALASAGYQGVDSDGNEVDAPVLANGKDNRHTTTSSSARRCSWCSSSLRPPEGRALRASRRAPANPTLTPPRRAPDSSCTPKLSPGLMQFRQFGVKNTDVGRNGLIFLPE